jgi:hypothetical protein
LPINPLLRRTAVAASTVALVSIAAASSGASSTPVRGAADRVQTTKLISHSFRGKTRVPNGASTHGVMSGDRRYVRIIAFQSDASDIVRGDSNRATDVFAIRRSGHPNNKGTRWKVGRTILVSRARKGRANGPSYAPAVDGSFVRRIKPKCVAFLSQASNLVSGDRNGVADAFLSRGPGGKPKLVSLLPGNRRAKQAVTRVAVSPDCKQIAFVSGGKLFLRIGGKRTKAINVPGAENDPSFSTGTENDLVFGGGRGVYLARKGTGKPRLVAPGGSNPAYNDVKRRVLAYEIRRGGHTQIGYKDLGHGQKIISSRLGHAGNGDSRDPVIGNAGYYVTFESDATNLGTDTSRQPGDSNGKPDVYLYTDVRRLTLVQSVGRVKGQPAAGGGFNPSMSFYANYILFDSPWNLRSGSGSNQVFMRWLGGL